VATATGRGNCGTMWSRRGEDVRLSPTGNGNGTPRHGGGGGGAGHVRYTSGGGGGGALDALVQRLQSGTLAQSTSGWTMSNCRDAAATATVMHY
jgi:hypothetical protein